MLYSLIILYSRTSPIHHDDEKLGLHNHPNPIFSIQKKIKYWGKECMALILGEKTLKSDARIKFLLARLKQFNVCFLFD